MDDLEHFVTNITPRTTYHICAKLDATKTLFKRDDYVMLVIQHTERHTVYIDKKRTPSPASRKHSMPT